MAQKRRRTHKKPESQQVWISPHLALRGLGNRRSLGEPAYGRILELADIALGQAEPEPAGKQQRDANLETEQPRSIPEHEQSGPVLVMDDATRKFYCPVCKIRFSGNASDAIELFRLHRCKKIAIA